MKLINDCLCKKRALFKYLKKRILQFTILAALTDYYILKHQDNIVLLLNPEILII